MKDVICLVGQTREDSRKKASIEILENAMELAREEGFVTIGVAAVKPNGDMFTICSEGRSLGALLGAFDILKYRILRANVAEED